MKIKQLLAVIAIIYSSIPANAQSKVLQTISADAKNSATTKIVATADRTVNATLDKVLDGSIFKKKASKAGSPDSPTQPDKSTNENLSGTTELSISNIDYSSIVALAEVIKSNKTVTDVQRSFSNGSGVINVNHASKTEELLDDILKNTSGKYEVAAVTKGKITLTIKK